MQENLIEVRVARTIENGLDEMIPKSTIGSVWPVGGGVHGYDNIVNF